MAFIEAFSGIFVGAIGLFSLLSMFVSIHIAYTTYENKDDNVACIGRTSWLANIWPKRHCNSADVQLRDSIIPCLVMSIVLWVFVYVFKDPWFIMAFWFTIVTSLIRISVVAYFAWLLNKRLKG